MGSVVRSRLGKIILPNEPGWNPRPGVSVADVQDDEFDGEALNPRWTWDNQGSMTVAQRKGCLVFQEGGTTGSRAIYQSLPSGDCRFELVGSQAGNYSNANIGIFVRNSTSGRMLVCGANFAASAAMWKCLVHRRTNLATWNANVVLSGFNNALAQGGDSSTDFLSMIIGISGTNVIWSLPTVGVVVRTSTATEALATFINAAGGTTDQVGVWLETASASNVSFALDSFRRIS